MELRASLELAVGDFGSPSYLQAGPPPEEGMTMRYRIYPLLRTP